MADEGLDRRPVDESLILDATTEEPGAQTTGAGVDAGDHPSRVLVAELDVVGDHKPAGIHRDQPAAEHVVTEQDLALASLEVGKVEVFPRELDAARSHRGDPVARDEQLAPRDAPDETGHRRVAALRESCDDVVHPAEPATRSIDKWAVQDSR